jgi:hypothetical protein
MRRSVNRSHRVILSANDPPTGYCLLIVPPSALRPHAVRKDHDLRYPRRHGTTKRWLSEPEVADAYRDRYSLAFDQAERVSGVLDAGLDAMELDGGAFIAVGMVPTGQGSMTIDLERVAAIETWVRQLGPPNYFGGFFVAPGQRSARPAVNIGAQGAGLRSRIRREPFK